MESKICREEIRNWEHPPWYGITRFEEKIIKIFWENQKGLHHIFKTHFQMPVKHEMISGPFQETSLTAITLNQGSSFTRREKIHFLFHWYILTSPGLLTRPWMKCSKAASMIIEISRNQEICPILGQVSHNSLYWKKRLQTDLCGLGGIDETASNMQAQNWRKSKIGQVKNRSSGMPESWQEFISWFWGYGVQRDCQECTEKIESSNSSRCAL